MTALALTRPRRLTGVAMLLSLVAGALASYAITSALRSDAPPAPPASHTAPGQAFTVAVPAGWRALPASRLASVAGHPVAVVARADGRGAVVVRHSSPVRATPAALARQLRTRLRTHFSGFHPLGARIARVRGGRAFVYTFVRAPHRTAQTIAFAQARGKAYEIDAVVPGGAPDAARDAAAIIASFGP